MLEMEAVFTVVACSVSILKVVFDSDEVGSLNDQQDDLCRGGMEGRRGIEERDRRERWRGEMEGGMEGRLVIAGMLNK